MNEDAGIKPVLFLDRAIDSLSLAERLKEAGADIRRHEDIYQGRGGIEDAVWLNEVGEKGWFVLTKDKRIIYRSLEYEALIRANVGAFFFMGGNMRGAEIAEILSKAYPKIERLALETPRPFFFKIYKDGRISSYEKS